jgi:hypothetical protein
VAPKFSSLKNTRPWPIRRLLIKYGSCPGSQAPCPMTVLVSLRRVLTRCLVERKEKSKTKSRQRRLFDPDNAFSMDDVMETFSSSESNLPVPDGVAHWEEQRRKWTKGHQGYRTAINGDSVSLSCLGIFSYDRTEYDQKYGSQRPANCCAIIMRL